MISQIFINLPVSDLNKSFELYTKMGFSNNPQFSDDSAKCMVWNDTIYVMLLTKEKMNTFITKPIANTKDNIAALYALSVESVDKIHEIVDNAISAGAKEPSEMKDYGFMKQRNIEDFDGHTWEIFYFDMSQIPVEK